jgi:hypothetical protein
VGFGICADGSSVHDCSVVWVRSPPVAPDGRAERQFQRFEHCPKNFTRPARESGQVLGTRRKCFCFKLLPSERLWREIRDTRVDASANCANLVTPLDSGTPLIRSSFYVHLGLQIGLNFVPAPIIEPLRRVEIPNRARD